jgi:hypothetical protein
MVLPVTFYAAIMMGCGRTTGSRYNQRPNIQGLLACLSNFPKHEHPNHIDVTEVISRLRLKICKKFDDILPLLCLDSISDLVDCDDHIYGVKNFKHIMAL